MSFVSSPDFTLSESGGVDGGNESNGMGSGLLSASMRFRDDCSSLVSMSGINLSSPPRSLRMSDTMYAKYSFGEVSPTRATRSMDDVYVITSIS